MIRRLKLMILVARPAVLALLGMFAATGLAEAGRGQDVLLLARALAVVGGFLAFSVACNDLADEAIDRINLAGDRGRPLVTGAANRLELRATAIASAAVALTVSATLHWPAVVVTVAGLALSAGYSLGPVRLADRGALASLLLPACYVAVPYLVGVFAVRASVGTADLTLLAGLYVGFIGRILLKDFRDVRGDAMFGKRTFLVRHGRRWTCAVSACCWTAGTVALLAAVPRPTPALIAGQAVLAAIALGLLWSLAAVSRPRHDEALISAIAIVGRGTILALLAHLSMTRVPALGREVILGALVAITVGQAALMVAHGPQLRAASTRRRRWSSWSRSVHSVTASPDPARTASSVPNCSGGSAPSRSSACSTTSGRVVPRRQSVSASQLWPK